MIGAFLTIFVACWVYQGAISVKRDNIVRWVAIAAIMVVLLQFLIMGLEILLFVDEDDNIDLTNEIGGQIQAIYRELMPSVITFFIAAVYRTKLVMQQPLSIGNLFSGMNIFKSSKSSGESKTEDTGSES